MKTLYALFPDHDLAEKATGALMDHGVRSEDISLIQHESKVPEERRSELRRPASESDVASPGAAEGTSRVYPDSGEVTTTGYAATPPREDATRPVDPDYEATSRDEDEDDLSAKSGISTTTGADAGSGALKGGAIGLGVGAIAALTALFVPGIGIVIGGGALAAALGGAAATAGAGAAAGAVVGYLKDQGVEERVAVEYGEHFERGGSILTVHVPSNDVDEARVREVLSKYGAANVSDYPTRSRPSYMA
jgi:hypothetical protein